jgi:hypothetical protein
MHPIKLAALVLMIPSAALAAPRSPLHPLDASTLPPQCQSLARTPASATTTEPDFAAHLSVANCLSEDLLARLQLRADPASIDAERTAVAPVLAMYRDVHDHGDAHWKAAADASLADLDTGMVVRIRSVANDPADHDGLEPKLSMLLQSAASARGEAQRLAVR